MRTFSLSRLHPTDRRCSVSYSCFFAAFDITRRVGLRVKTLFEGASQPDWRNFVSFSSDDEAVATPPGHTPTVARVAQATTIVAGGITASLVAEMAGRPFKACQRLSQHAGTDPHPIRDAYRTQGLRPFIYPDASKTPLPTARTLNNVVKRLGWRLAAVGPWGFGFLVWAWVGGEV